jgi:hypothetical protein
MKFQTKNDGCQQSSDKACEGQGEAKASDIY